MIRARMSFGGVYLYHNYTEEEKLLRKEKGYTNWNIYGELLSVPMDEAIEKAQIAWDTGQFIQIECRWYAVYTPDPTNPNASWAKATPNGNINMTIQNPGALRNLKNQIEKAEKDGRKSGIHPTKEFYVDFYAAPAED